ncbi:MAG: hypothetical protein ACKER6_00650 [Candidatus Hodgkinia cicadicola]
MEPISAGPSADSFALNGAMNDAGQRKYLLKKAASQLKRRCRPLACKHVEIKSNISANDLSTKTNLVRRFAERGHKVDVLAKFAKFMTAPSAYETFVNNLKSILVRLGHAVTGPNSFDNGDVAFSVVGTRSQSQSC